MDDVARFSKILEDIQFAMLTTVSAKDGTLRSRPMTLQQAEFNGDLWFFAGRSSAPAEDLRENSQVNLAFADVKANSYMSVTGQGEVVLDAKKAEELWNPLLKAWFPKGLQDPELCLIKVRVESADYWDSPSSAVVQLIGFAKAIVTGKPADDTLGKREHWS